MDENIRENMLFINNKVIRNNSYKFRKFRSKLIENLKNTGINKRGLILFVLFMLNANKQFIDLVNLIFLF